MKKKLNTSGVMSELRGNSPFFPSQSHLADNEPAIPSSSEDRVAPQKQKQIAEKETSIQASDHASLHASTLAIPDLIEHTRKTLRLLGKEVIYVRSTQQEKDQIADIVYTLKRQGMKTSDNEICRIAINFLLAEYKANGEESTLAKVLKALHA